MSSKVTSTSLLSQFLKTDDFSLSGSPMFKELVENIKANKIVIESKKQ